MCGIAGFLGAWPEQLLAPMAAALRHRGPDGEGIWWSEQDEIGLAHRRLAIIDCSDNAAQPMVSCSGRYHVVFNGEIYNFRALAAELRNHGYEFNEHSDTAVLGPLYDLHGPGMLRRLNGIFAFALWDAKKKRLFAARDGVGVKPFYYAKTSRGLAFASELKALMLLPDLDHATDKAALCDYLVHLWSPGQRTMLQHVKKLLPGHYLIAERGKTTENHKWYFPEIAAAKSSFTGPTNLANAGAELLALLDAVVADQCVADVPIGAFLSGGIDSSAIVAAMLATGNRPAKAYCVGYSGPSLSGEGFEDDLPYARAFAASLGVPLEPIIVGSIDGSDLERLVYDLEEPQADPAPIYVKAISEAARTDGIKVLMSGAGGDDVFSGYRRHAAAALRAWTGRLGKSTSQILSLTGRMVSSPARRRLDRIGYMLQGSDEQFLLRAFEFTSSDLVGSCVAEDVRRARTCADPNRLELAMIASRGTHLVDRMLSMELAGFLPDHNLNYTDKAAMAAGVEVRVPFLDDRILSFASGLPPNFKVRRGHTKWLLRRALKRRLPKAILQRSKTGFGAPVRLWVRGSLREAIEDILSSESFRSRGLFEPEGVRGLAADTFAGRRDGAYLLLAIIMVELWLRQF
jgi:asparagine synthase (glutamine-hydrolysing)